MPLRSSPISSRTLTKPLAFGGVLFLKLIRMPEQELLQEFESRNQQHHDFLFYPFMIAIATNKNQSQQIRLRDIRLKENCLIMSTIGAFFGLTSRQGWIIRNGWRYVVQNIPRFHFSFCCDTLEASSKWRHNQHRYMDIPLRPRMAVPKDCLDQCRCAWDDGGLVLSKYLA